MDTNRILAAINAHRRRHGAEDLQWDPACAAAAQNWANCGQFLREQDNGRFGENLAVSDSSYDVTYEITNAINMWQLEGRAYDYNNPGFSSRSGNFSQNVWRSTTRVGFGFGSAVDQYGRYWPSFVVAKFSAPGNIEGNFETNVLPPGS
ncbi:unnamed protein product, partial [Hapterophycus canaliculatus]